MTTITLTNDSVLTVTPTTDFPSYITGTYSQSYDPDSATSAINPLLTSKSSLQDPTGLRPKDFAALMLRPAPDFEEVTHLFMDEVPKSSKVIGCALGKVAYEYGARNREQFYTFVGRLTGNMDTDLATAWNKISWTHCSHNLTIQQIALELAQIDHWSEVEPALVLAVDRRNPQPPIPLTFNDPS